MKKISYSFLMLFSVVSYAVPFNIYPKEGTTVIDSMLVVTHNY